jgi:hypothetical protein
MIEKAVLTAAPSATFSKLQYFSISSLGPAVTWFIEAFWCASGAALFIIIQHLQQY